MSLDWTEKYRPRSLAQVVGNPSSVQDLKTWADSWNKGIPKFRAVVLMGPPGVGKTTCAEALAADMGWGLVEMNASDQRTGEAIKSVALRGAGTDTFDDSGNFLRSSDGKRKLIVLDEADSLFGRQDRGAMPVITELIKETKQPVILIVNDFYELSRRSSSIKTYTLQIKFRRPPASTIAKALGKVAAAEGVDVGDMALRKIAENAGGDVRAAVRDLESYSMGRTAITSEDLENLSERVARKDVYELIGAIFSGKAMESRQLMYSVDEKPEDILLWVDENIPYNYRDTGDLVRGYEKLARADVYLGRVSRRQYYGFWSYAGDMMTAGVAVARRTKPVPSRDAVRYPSYIKKMSYTKGVRALKKTVCLKISIMMHTSTARVSNDVLPSLKAMLANDSALRVAVTADAGLEPEELAFLLDSKADSPAVKAVFAAMAGPRPEAPAEKPSRHAVVEPAPEPKAETVPEPAAKPAPKAQKNLFDF